MHTSTEEWRESHIKNTLKACKCSRILPAGRDKYVRMERIKLFRELILVGFMRRMVTQYYQMENGLRCNIQGCLAFIYILTSNGKLFLTLSFSR